MELQSWAEIRRIIDQYLELPEEEKEKHEPEWWEGEP